MPHADSALIPESVKTRREFWDHVYEQLVHLFADQRAWVSNLANAASLIYNSLLAFPLFGSGNNAVNWCGPFCGKPACQSINVSPTEARGVCADAFLRKSAILVPDVGAYRGHIACDDKTNSELVIPLILDNPSEANQASNSPDSLVAGVLDLDCLALAGFQEEDRLGLERIATLITHSCDW